MAEHGTEAVRSFCHFESRGASRAEYFSRLLIPALLCTLFPVAAAASTGAGDIIDLTRSNVGYDALVIFVLAYIVVMSEEFTHLRKSKPVILMAGVIWGMIAFVYAGHG